LLFLQYYEKSWNTKNTNDPGLVRNLTNHVDTSTILDELEKVLKLTKNGESTEEDNII
jgi:hypothetical protein